MDKELRQSTILMYDKIYSRFKNTKYIDDPKRLASMLERNSSTPKYISTILIAIRYNLTNKKLIEKYSKLISHYLTLANSQKKTHKEEACAEWKELLLRAEHYINTKQHLKNYLRNKTLILLYTTMPPRRLLDYQKLVWVKNAESDIKNKEYNYFIRSTGQIVFNVYKTRTNRPQIIKLSNAARDALNTYIKESEILEGHLIFDVDTSTIAHQLTRIFKCSVNGLRHSYITALYKDRETPSNDKIQQQADLMGHQLSTHLSYRTGIKEEVEEVKKTPAEERIERKTKGKIIN